MKKYYPFPLDILGRTIIREDQRSERLKRMTEEEERGCNFEIFVMVLKDLIDAGIKPKFPLIKEGMEKKSKICDEIFDEIMLDTIDINGTLSNNDPGDT